MHVIALGDVSEPKGDCTMTHTRYAFVKAAWHADIVDRSFDGFCDVIPAGQIDVITVPGAFEMPLMAATWQRPANTALSFVRHLLSTEESTATILWPQRL